MAMKKACLKQDRRLITVNLDYHRGKDNRGIFSVLKDIEID